MPTWTSCPATDSTHSSTETACTTFPRSRNGSGSDDDFTYVINRGIAAHDLIHVLGGCGPDIGGEFGVLAFTHGQVGGIATGASVAMVMAVPLAVRRSERLRWWKEAVQRGRAADLLFAVPYEDLVDDPIDDVRRRLRIQPSHEAHPHGHL